MPGINLRQAQRPPGARCLENSWGTAPGIAAAWHRCRIWCLPGPPVEMQPMFERFVMPALFDGGRERPRLLIESIPVYGLGESAVAERLGELMHRDRNPLVGTTASGSIVTVRLRAHGAASEDRAGFERLVEEILRRTTPYALGRGACTLPEALARECGAVGATVALAESCTAGLVSSLLADVPGASAWYRGAAVTYSNESKHELLGVPIATIERHGAVSERTAHAMALGALDRFGASASAAVTGIAGPTGGTEAKPVGTVFIATARRGGGSSNDEVVVRRFAFPGDRAAIRDRSAKAAIGALRFHLRGEEATPLLWQRSESGSRT